MDIYNPQTDRKYQLLSANNLDNLQQLIADYYRKDSTHNIQINPDGSVSLINSNGSITSGCQIVKQVVRNQTITGYVFMNHIH